jgi:hypothetical protein
MRRDFTYTCPSKTDPADEWKKGMTNTTETAAHTYRIAGLTKHGTDCTYGSPGIVAESRAAAVGTSASRTAHEKNLIDMFLVFDA